MKLMIVAHPDDESLFGGAQLIQDGNWKVICVTNGNNLERRAEFEKVMNLTHSSFEIWDYLDERLTLLEEDKLKDGLNEIIDSYSWDKIVTHNERGEYGHLHHKQIHQLVREITCGDFSMFDYDNQLALPEIIWQSKLNLIRQYRTQSRVCRKFITKVRNERIKKYE